MMNEDWIRSCATRHFRGSPSFHHPASAGTAVDADNHEVNAGDWKTLGTIVGSPATAGNRVLIYDKGIIYYHQDSPERLRYDDMSGVDLAGDKTSADLEIRRKDGKVVCVRITTEKGSQYNPVLRLLTFIRCVLETPPNAFKS